MIRLITSAWFRYVRPAWGVIPSAFQAWLSSDIEHRGLGVLRYLRTRAPRWGLVSSDMDQRGFSCDEVSLRWFGFSQRPWITAASGCGRSDDWAYLWRDLAEMYGEVEIIVVKKKGGGLFMASILDDGVESHLFANLEHIRSTPSSNRKALENSLFGYDKTEYVIHMR